MEEDYPGLTRKVSTLELGLKEMKDALLVHAILEAKAASRVKEHAQELAEHATWLRRHQLAMSEIEGKLNVLTNIVSDGLSPNRSS